MEIDPFPEILCPDIEYFVTTSDVIKIFDCK